MSKSVGKYKTIGFCTGSNTEYYRNKRKADRRANNHNLRNFIANKAPEDYDEFTDIKKPFKNDWDEPTDGTFKAYPNEVRTMYGGNIYLSKDGKIKK